MNKAVNNIESTEEIPFGNIHQNTGGSQGGFSIVAKKRDAMNAALVEKTAKIMKCSESEVYKVLRGERINEQVFTCYMELTQGINKLLKAVEKLVPFDIN